VDVSEHYQVVRDDLGEEGGCDHCGHGRYWTIVYGAGTPNGEVGVGSSWMDKGLAEDICGLMNDAYASGYEAGIEVGPEVNAEEAKLVAFFQSAEGDKLGRDGDYDNLTPAETAIRFMKKHR
jgi:hypothetical protein